MQQHIWIVLVLTHSSAVLCCCAFCLMDARPSPYILLLLRNLQSVPIALLQITSLGTWHWLTNMFPQAYQSSRCDVNAEPYHVQEVHSHHGA